MQTNYIFSTESNVLIKKLFCKNGKFSFKMFEKLFLKFFGEFYSFNYGISNSNKSLLTFVMWTINDLSIEHEIEQLGVLFFVDLQFLIDVFLNYPESLIWKNLRFWKTSKFHLFRNQVKNQNQHDFWSTQW